MAFWACESWVHAYAWLHRSDCNLCNAGQGTRGAVDSAGRWLGPFESLRQTALCTAVATTVLMVAACGDEPRPATSPYTRVDVPNSTATISTVELQVSDSSAPTASTIPCQAGNPAMSVASAEFTPPSVSPATLGTLFVTGSVRNDSGQPLHMTFLNYRWSYSDTSGVTRNSEGVVDLSATPVLEPGQSATWQHQQLTPVEEEPTGPVSVVGAVWEWIHPTTRAVDRPLCPNFQNPD